MLNEWNDSPDRPSNVVRLPTWREKRRLKRLRDATPFPEQWEEPKLTWDHWAIGLVIVGSLGWALYTLIVTV